MNKCKAFIILLAALMICSDTEAAHERRRLDAATQNPPKPKPKPKPNATDSPSSTSGGSNEEGGGASTSTTSSGSSGSSSSATGGSSGGEGSVNSDSGGSSGRISSSNAVHSDNLDVESESTTKKLTVLLGVAAVAGVAIAALVAPNRKVETSAHPLKGSLNRRINLFSKLAEHADATSRPPRRDEEGRYINADVIV